MLNWLWPKRPSTGASAAGPVESVELRHLDGVVADQVRAFFAGELPEFHKDGRRSVRIAHPLKDDAEIKIKGSGFEGGFIQFGMRRETGPKAPLFDPPTNV